MTILKDVRQYAAVAFLLLGVLFGMVVMTYIFGQLGTASISSLADDTTTKTNVTGAYVNETGYTIAEANEENFNGNVVITEVINATDEDGSILPVANYTVNAATGVITNATDATYPDVNVSYTYSQKTSAKLATEDANNNSLQSVINYSGQSETQFTTVAIAITLVVLIGLFYLFWRMFTKNKKNKKSSFGGNFA